jgi:hypothetical protein
LFDDVRAGAAVKQVVMLTNRRAEPVRLLKLEAQPSSYRCLLPAWTDQSRPLSLEPWDRVALEVSFIPGSAPDRRRASVAGDRGTGSDTSPLPRPPAP